MRKLRTVSWVAVAVVAMSAAAFAADGQVTGTVKAVSDRSLTVVTGDGEEWTLDVTPATRVVAEGASRRAELLVSEGRRTTLDEFVREDQRVTVTFSEESGARTATRVRAH